MSGSSIVLPGFVREIGGLSQGIALTSMSDGMGCGSKTEREGARRAPGIRVRPAGLRDDGFPAQASFVSDSL
jgi:hypothetical protein